MLIKFSKSVGLGLPRADSKSEISVHSPISRAICGRACLGLTRGKNPVKPPLVGMFQG